MGSNGNFTNSLQDLVKLAKSTGCIRVFRNEDDELIAVLSIDRTDTFAEIDLLPLEKWVTDEFIEEEVSRVQVKFTEQESITGDHSATVYPGEWNYDYDRAEDEILNNLDFYCRKEVCNG